MAEQLDGHVLKMKSRPPRPSGGGLDTVISLRIFAKKATWTVNSARRLESLPTRQDSTQVCAHARGRRLASP